LPHVNAPARTRIPAAKTAKRDPKHSVCNQTARARNPQLPSPATAGTSPGTLRLPHRHAPLSLSTSVPAPRYGTPAAGFAASEQGPFFGMSSTSSGPEQLRQRRELPQSSSSFAPDRRRSEKRDYRGRQLPAEPALRRF